MSYSTDFYKTKSDGTLDYICSVSGSDAPCHFEKVKTLEDVQDVINRLKEEDVTIWHQWPVPWEDSKTSDDCVIFELLERKKWQFWKDKNPVKFWIGTYYEKYGKLKDTRKMYFSDIPKSEHTSNYGEDKHWQLDHLRVFDLPQMRVKL